jgi:formate/nitrite transporter FocA (FNT family)
MEEPRQDDRTRDTDRALAGADGRESGSWTEGESRPVEQDAEAPELDAREREKADEEEELNVGVTYEVIRRAGRDELRRSTSALAWSGLAAGLSMGFSLTTEAYLRTYVGESGAGLLISRMGYTIGFLIVILGKQQLFTENTLTAVIPLLARRTPAALRNTLRLWGVVLAANLAGALLFALALQAEALFTPPMNEALAAVAGEAFQGSFARTFFLAIPAGWLIALMVWMLPGAKELGVVIILIITFVVRLAGFPHIIAGAVDVFYAGFHGLADWGTIGFRYLLPTLLGNTIGGVALVSGLAHAQVVAGNRQRA